MHRRVSNITSISNLNASAIKEGEVWGHSWCCPFASEEWVDHCYQASGRQVTSTLIQNPVCILSWGFPNPLVKAGLSKQLDSFLHTELSKCLKGSREGWAHPNTSRATKQILGWSHTLSR